MDTRWLQNVPKDKQNEFKKLIFNSSQILGRLQEILEEEEQSLRKTETTEKDFDNPNWAFRQAYRNGELSRIRKLKDLLNFRKD